MGAYSPREIKGNHGWTWSQSIGLWYGKHGPDWDGLRKAVLKVKMTSPYWVVDDPEIVGSLYDENYVRLHRTAKEAMKVIEDYYDMPESMRAGWDPSRPGREAAARAGETYP